MARIEPRRPEKGLTRLSNEDREFVIQKLVEALVLDYQANQEVPRDMVQSTTGSHRKVGQVGRRT